MVVRPARGGRTTAPLPSLGISGNCTYAAAEEVCDADPDLLQSLLDKSLLRRRATGGGPRYWMLVTIREYAAELLDESGDGDAVHQQLTDWAHSFTRAAEPGWRTSDSRAWIGRFLLELDNLR